MKLLLKKDPDPIFVLNLCTLFSGEVYIMAESIDDNSANHAFCRINSDGTLYRYNNCYAKGFMVDKDKHIIDSTESKETPT